MIIENLRLFVASLREVVDTLPEAQEVNMSSILPPGCGTPGCHAGLAMLALDRLGAPAREDGWYDFEREADRLARYLGLGADSSALEKWALGHRYEWGNDDGDMMFCHHVAFGQESPRFPGRVISHHWAGVLTRIEEGEK